MGCGFSSEDSKASDEERILKSTPTSSGSSTSSELKLGAKGKKTDTANKSDESNGKTSSKVGKSSPLNIQRYPKYINLYEICKEFDSSSTTEVSSSQVNFFKMLDEKIENGLDLDEPDSEGERQLRLQRVAEEWDNLLGRSQDSNDLSSKGIEFLNPAGTTTEAQMSNDSMRTMFSNSVNVPAGTLREVVTQSDTKKSE